MAARVQARHQLDAMVWADKTLAGGRLTHPQRGHPQPTGEEMRLTG
ncbi:MAG: hypothetical protein HND48_25470 [Chloroflexi bacterium]|nr:hypothetical protein [Chloroflexota bacterium]